MNFSGYVGHVTIFTIANCFVVGLGLGLDIVSGWLVAMHTYLYYFRLSLSHCHPYLKVPRYRLSMFGHWAFSIAGPTSWNSLPDRFRYPALSSDSFKDSGPPFPGVDISRGRHS